MDSINIRTITTTNTTSTIHKSGNNDDDDVSSNGTWDIEDFKKNPQLYRWSNVHKGFCLKNEESTKTNTRKTATKRKSSREMSISEQQGKESDDDNNIDGGEQNTTGNQCHQRTLRSTIKYPVVKSAKKKKIQRPPTPAANNMVPSSSHFPLPSSSIIGTKSKKRKKPSKDFNCSETTSTTLQNVTTNEPRRLRSNKEPRLVSSLVEEEKTIISSSRSTTSSTVSNHKDKQQQQQRKKRQIRNKNNKNYRHNKEEGNGDNMMNDARSSDNDNSRPVSSVALGGFEESSSVAVDSTAGNIEEERSSSRHQTRSSNKKKLLSEDPFEIDEYDESVESESENDKILLQKVGYSKLRHKKVSKARIVLFKDDTKGFPIMKEKAKEITRVGAFRKNRLIREGYLKHNLLDFKHVNFKWQNEHRELKHGSDMNGCKLIIQFQEITKICKGVFYVNYLQSPKDDDKIPSSMKELSLQEITDFYDKMFGCRDSETFIVNFFELMEKLPGFSRRNQTQLILPYFREFETIEMDEDEKRTGLRLAGLYSPLIEVCKHRLGSRKKIDGVTTPMTTLGFPGSPITPTSLNQGPAMGLLHQIKFGRDKTWLISPPRYMEKIQKKIKTILREKLLDSSHPLMQNPLNCILNHGSVMLGPKFFTKYKIPFTIVTQSAGEIMMIASRAVYSGLNHGMNGTEQVGIIGPDFHITYNEGQAINQCECEIGTPKSQGIKTSNPGPKFTLNPGEIKILLRKSEEWVKESRSKFAHLLVSTTRRKSKKSPRVHKCEYCGAGFATSKARDNHEDRKKCNRKCKIASCKKSKESMSVRDMLNHIKHNHANQADLIEQLQKEEDEEILARIKTRRAKEEANKKKVQKLKDKNNKKENVFKTTKTQTESDRNDRGKTSSTSTSIKTSKNRQNER